MTGAVELADATKAPYEFGYKKRTFYYRAAGEVSQGRGISGQWLSLKRDSVSDLLDGVISSGAALQA